MDGPWNDFASATSGPWTEFAPAVGVGQDIANTAFPSTIRSAAGAVGAMGDIGSLIGAASDKIGIPQKFKEAVRDAAATQPILSMFAKGPTSQQLLAAEESAAGSPLYKPQTIPGQYVDTAIQFAPAVAGGPGNLGRRIAGQVLIPAITSETAGQLTKGTAAEPYARVAGGVAGGVAGARATAPRAAEAAIPATEQIRDAARAGYQHPEVAAVQIKPESLDYLSTRISSSLDRQGLKENNVGSVYRALDDLKGPAPKMPSAAERLQAEMNWEPLPAPIPRSPSTVADVDSVRKNLGEIAKEVNPIGRPTPAAVAAGKAQRQIDQYLNNLHQPELLAGDAKRASAILQQARADWAAASKAEDIGVRLTRAERQAAKAGSGSNIDNALRQKISAVLDVPSRAVGLRPNEIAQAEKVVRGTATGNALRKVGKLGFNDGLSLLLHAGATLPTGGLNIPIGIAGTIARKIGERMTQREANRLEEMIRMRSAEAERWRAIHARTIGVLPPSLGGTAGGLLGSLGGSSQLRGGLLPFDQRWPGLEQLQ